MFFCNWAAFQRAIWIQIGIDKFGIQIELASVFFFLFFSFFLFFLSIFSASFLFHASVKYLFGVLTYALRRYHSDALRSQLPEPTGRCRGSHSAASTVPHIWFTLYCLLHSISFNYGYFLLHSFGAQPLCDKLFLRLLSGITIFTVAVVVVIIIVFP